MALLSSYTPILGSGSLGSGAVLLPWRRWALLAQRYNPVLVGYHRPVTTQCLVLRPAAIAAQILAPRAGAATEVGP